MRMYAKPEEAPYRLIPFMPASRHEWFDRLATNGIDGLPFVPDTRHKP